MSGIRICGLTVVLALLTLVMPTRAIRPRPSPPVTVTAWPQVVLAGPHVVVRVTVSVLRHPDNRGVYLQWWIGDRGEQGLSYWSIDGDSPVQHVRYVRYVRHPGALVIRATLVREIGGRARGYKAETTVEVR